MHIAHCFSFFNILTFVIDLFPPAELNVGPQSTSISLSWEYYNNCSLTRCTIMYEATWQQSGDGSSFWNTATTETSYTIENLTPGTSYEIGVGAFCKENTTIRSEVQLQVHETTSVNSGKLLLCCDVSIVCGARLQTSSFRFS